MAYIRWLMTRSSDIYGQGRERKWHRENMLIWVNMSVIVNYMRLYTGVVWEKALEHIFIRSYFYKEEYIQTSKTGSHEKHMDLE